jgi:small-conductance mechanosensitive channel
VSGLILLFERPIQIGDLVQLTDLQGEVLRIGIRSSTIRTYDGAEVIVPNATLIQERVTNWTLSDRVRRVEIAVGGAYGTEPSEMIEVLLRVARAQPLILGYPAPMALFRGFGDSSLDFVLRCWISMEGDWVKVRSDLGIAVYRALRDAGIEIPFPRRDLHLYGAATSVAEAESPAKKSQP